MFYYLIEPILMYNWILILAAIVPAIFLMIKVYKSDRIEKESGYLLRRLVVAGILSTLFARIEERLGIWILSSVVSTNTVLYNVILYFGIVAIAEESSKYIMLKRNTWNNWAFNCQYIPELRLAIEVEATTITEQRSQMVKEHICECNGIRYVKLKHSNDLIKTAQSIKEAFRKCHTFFQTNDEEDIEILRTRFQNWRKQK